MALMDKRLYSILLLKDKPAGQDSNDSHEQHQNDPYKTALHALTKHNVEITVEYLAPMTTVFPEHTLLSKATSEGYPRTPYRLHREESSLETIMQLNTVSSSSEDIIWAFAVTSQNAVYAIEMALQRQPDPDIREAWLQIPIYSLTGATLANVKRIGFKNINCSTVLASELPSASSLSFDNAAQLVDFLVSIEWPSTGGGKDGIAVAAPTPTLWFLTGETRMKTMAEKLTAHQKPFQEVVVYGTEERPEFEKEFYHWLRDTSGLHSNERVSQIGLSESGSAAVEVKARKTLWLVGFSPRGIDIAAPTLTRFFGEAKDGQNNSMRDSPGIASVEIRWAAIGGTTARRIQEYLLNSLQAASVSEMKQQQELILHSAVTVAKAPKPDALAEAIFS